MNKFYKILFIFFALQLIANTATPMDPGKLLQGLHDSFMSLMSAHKPVAVTEIAKQQEQDKLNQKLHHLVITEVTPAHREQQILDIKNLLQTKADPNSQYSGNDRKRTTLHNAVIYNPHLIPLLLEHGANIHATDTGGFTPLHQAAQGSTPATVKVLLNHQTRMSNDPHAMKKFVNTRDLFGQTPLHYTVQHHQPVSTKLLLQHGADTTIQSAFHKTPLQDAEDNLKFGNHYPEIHATLMRYAQKD